MTNQNSDMENLQIRLSRDLINRIDTFRRSKPFRPNRTQTIRWLLESGLERETGTETPPQRRATL